MSLCLVVTADAANRRFTLVVDAGHGGRDAGAIGGAGTKEKNLTLKFALAFGRLVEQNCPDVRVIYTRKTDTFVELYRRAEIANQNKADLFISIHINSLPKGHQAQGFQTYTLGKSRRTGKNNGVQENLEVAKRENAVIFLEDNYQQTYHGYDPNSPESNIMFEFMQDKNMENSIDLAKFMQKYVCEAAGRHDMGAHQDNLAVLRLTSMPGCLIELGFISSAEEERFMNSAGAAERYARGIYNAFAAYKRKHNGSITVPYLPTPKDPKPVEPQETKPVQQDQPKEQPQEQQNAQPQVQAEPGKPEPSAEQTTTDKPVFKVQILTSNKQLRAGDAQFKGRKDVDSYKEGGIVKYTVGASTDYQEIYQLRKSLLDKFPQAFIVAFKNGEKVNVQTAIQEYRSNKRK